jgi:hypothetical protein
MGMATAGNALRPSSAPPDVRIVNNFPGRYPTADWLARYWAMSDWGELQVMEVTLQLPTGYAAGVPAISVGYNGCIYKVRRWGVACYPSLLEDMGFDHSPLLTYERQRFPGGDDQEALHIMLHVTHFDLPGGFVIASREHPFLLYDPRGVLKGSFVRWRSYAGALAYLATEGKINAPFLRLQEEGGHLYDQAVGYLLQALRHNQ